LHEKKIKARTGFGEGAVLSQRLRGYSANGSKPTRLVT